MEFSHSIPKQGHRQQVPVICVYRNTTIFRLSANFFKPNWALCRQIFPIRLSLPSITICTSNRRFMDECYWGSGSRDWPGWVDGWLGTNFLVWYLAISTDGLPDLYVPWFLMACFLCIAKIGSRFYFRFVWFSICSFDFFPSSCCVMAELGIDSVTQPYKGILACISTRQIHYQCEPSETTKLESTSERAFGDHGHLLWKRN